jgi:hypothetical protein
MRRVEGFHIVAILYTYKGVATTPWRVSTVVDRDGYVERHLGARTKLILRGVGTHTYYKGDSKITRSG